ncbi:hypothetical protein D3C86_1753380 [compost metagenome]
MFDFAVNAPVYFILLIVSINTVFGDKVIALHVPESLVKAFVGNDGIDKGFDTKFLRLDVHRRIQLDRFDGIRVKTLDLLRKTIKQWCCKQDQQE